MNTKRFLLTSFAVFVVLTIFDMIVHGMILGKTYMELQTVFRPEADMMSKMWVMYVTGAVFSLLFVYIFAKGYEGKGIVEGLKYGFIMGLIFAFVGSYNQFVVYPLPYSLILKWFIFGTIELMLAGAVAALIYKPKD